MGQSSSASSKRALPSNNLLIDASDSYVTEVKLKSTGIIPISEYIKKDKYSKNIQRLQQVKKNAPEKKSCKGKEKNGKPSNKLFTIKEEEKIEKEKENKHKKLTQAISTATVKTEKTFFIESSFEDIPSKRKWISINNTTLKPQSPQSKTSDKNNLKNQKTQTSKKESTLPVEDPKLQEIKSTSSEEIRQLYKNRIYPHIYKNKYNRKAEQKRKVKPPVPSESQLCFSDTEIQKKLPEKIKRRTRFEESTHQLNQHHYQREKSETKKPKQNKFSVHTNIACVIHPDRRKQLYLASSEETFKRNPPLEGSFYTTRRTAPASTPIHRKLDTTIDKVTKEHRKILSGKQALENWKNIHTLKQHRKQSNTNYTNYSNNYLNYPQDNYRYNNRPPYEERIEDYHPSRPRSRGGCRAEESNCNQRKSPLDVSNYNYSKPPGNIKVVSMSPKEISNYNYSKIHENNKIITPKDVKERTQRMNKQRSFRDYSPPEYTKPESPRCSDNTSYIRYAPFSNRYQHYEEERNYFRNTPRPEFSERDEREDFIADMERCLQNKIASVYGVRHSGHLSPNKSTWVQDKYRRWHKVIMD